MYLGYGSHKWWNNVLVKIGSQARRKKNLQLRNGDFVVKQEMQNQTNTKEFEVSFSSLEEKFSPSRCISVLFHDVIMLYWPWHHSKMFKSVPNLYNLFWNAAQLKKLLKMRSFPIIVEKNGEAFN